MERKGLKRLRMVNNNDHINITFYSMFILKSASEVKRVHV